MKRTLIISALLAAMFAASASAGYVYRRHHVSAYQRGTGIWLGYSYIDQMPEYQPQCFDLYIDYYHIAGARLNLIKIGDIELLKEAPDLIDEAIGGPEHREEIVKGIYGLKNWLSFPNVVRTYEGGGTQTFEVKLFFGFIWHYGTNVYAVCDCWTKTDSCCSSGSSGSDMHEPYHCGATDYMSCNCWQFSHWIPNYHSQEEWESEFDYYTGSTAETRKRTPPFTQTWE